MYVDSKISMLEAHTLKWTRERWAHNLCSFGYQEPFISSSHPTVLAICDRFDPDMTLRLALNNRLHFYFGWLPACE